MSNAMESVVRLAELIKHRFVGLHQVSRIEDHEFADEWEPLYVGMEALKHTRKVTMLTITLSKTAQDTGNVGYQLPIPEEDVKAYEENAPKRERAPRKEGEEEKDGESKRGRGGRPRGRGGRRGRGDAAIAAIAEGTETRTEAEVAEKAEGRRGGRGRRGRDEQQRNRAVDEKKTTERGGRGRGGPRNIGA